MKGVSGVPTLKGYFTEANRCILVMETLGENVINYIQKAQAKLTDILIAGIGQ